jgi:hypothetical protein
MKSSMIKFDIEYFVVIKAQNPTSKHGKFVQQFNFILLDLPS